MEAPKANELKRCECRVRVRTDEEYRCGGPHHTASDECKNEAVRMVTVRYRWPVRDDEQHISTRPVPMCVACADWHEARK